MSSLFIIPKTSPSQGQHFWPRTDHGKYPMHHLHLSDSKNFFLLLPSLLPNVLLPVYLVLAFLSRKSLNTDKFPKLTRMVKSWP